MEIDDFLAEADKDLQFIIPNVLCPGDRVIFTGPEGGGKTTFTRQLAIQTASGVHPFTLGAMEPIRVLFLDFENPRGLARKEFRWIRNRSNSYVKGNLHIELVPQGIDIMDTEDYKWMTSLVEQHEPQLLICGPFYKMVSADLIKDEVAKPALMRLDILRADYDIALWMEAHCPLGGEDRPTRPYGSSVQLRWPEFGLHMSADGKVSHWRGPRDRRDWPKKLERGGKWPWTTAIAPPKMDAFEYCRSHLLTGSKMFSRDELQKKCGMTQTEAKQFLAEAKAKKWTELKGPLGNVWVGPSLVGQPPIKGGVQPTKQTDEEVGWSEPSLGPPSTNQAEYPSIFIDDEDL